MHSRPRGPSCLHGGGKKKKNHSRQIWTSSALSFRSESLYKGRDSNKGNKSICYLHVSKAGLWNPFPLTGMRSPWWRWHQGTGRDSQQRLYDEIFFTRVTSTNEVRDISAAMASYVWSHTSQLCLYQVSPGMLETLKIFHCHLFNVF